MKWVNYRTTHLEDFVDELYKRLNIQRPEQLTVDEVSSALRLIIHPGPTSCTFGDGQILTIFLDKSLDETGKWIDFLHELCHVLRHAGNQFSLTRAMRAWQECDADKFVLYASMPFLMLRKINLPSEPGAATELISTTFRVPIELAHMRYQQILRRLYYAMWG
ncbi:hypothetical protein B2K_16145 [Paenibacillus mucilaginosus K02]|uniref:IrrE N-terminal-like domain-containing protein n=2 Tax=Paenibacillus mucilaginosus TaxID=61624 RepID=I0BIN6_9BACL|nr:hypothetical protein B2K_16145 [Paenibacillus mucilaginosus K02]